METLSTWWNKTETPDKNAWRNYADSATCHLVFKLAILISS